MSNSVTTSKQGAVTVVTLSRPQARNAVDAETARQLYTAFAEFDADTEARVAVFHGAHGHFCAGWDLKYGASLQAQGAARGQAQRPLRELDFDAAEVRTPQAPGASDASSPAGPLGPMGPSRMLLSNPVIAAVSGAAVAGGMELALWCDLRVMEEDAYFGIYCRRFGVPLIDGGTVRLPRLVGMGHAMDLILTGRRVDPPEALAMGLCNRVVPTGQALQAAVKLAEQLCDFPQATMRADRASAYAQWDLDLPQALHQEWQRGKERIADGMQGAARFAAGQGRHGKF